MPETVFDLQFPDGATERCYSPSTVVFEHLDAGTALAVAELRPRLRIALGAAAERVKDKYGYYCSAASDQLAALEARLDAFGPHSVVRVLAVHPKASAPPFDEVVAQEQTRIAAARSRIPLEGSYPVVIVGGGQAGLAMSWHLTRAGLRHLVLEKHAIGHAWRNERWNNFCLVTPNWQCRLPGFPYRGDDPDGFMPKDAIVEYVEGFAASFEPPIQEGVTVERITPEDGGGYTIVARRGQEVCEIEADQVVVAAGAYGAPRIPEYAGGISEDILQLHSSTYRKSASLPEGAVLVVGSGQSGCQIAEDLHFDGRKVLLSVGNAPRSPRHYRGRDVVAWLEEMGHYDAAIADEPDPEATRRKTNHYLTGRDGGREIDLRAHARDGMRLLGRLDAIDASGRATFHDDLVERLDAADATYVRIREMIDRHIVECGLDLPAEPPYQPCWLPDEVPTALDLQDAGVSVIVWAIGFHQSFDSVHADVFDSGGYPRHLRGVTDAPGLYFLGLPWLHSWGSGRFSHVDRDARHLFEAILQRASAA